MTIDGNMRLIIIIYQLFVVMAWLLLSIVTKQLLICQFTVRLDASVLADQ